MVKRIVLTAALGIALAAAGVATAAAVTHQSADSLVAGSATAGRVTLHKTKLGKVLATSTGRTLYLFMKDKSGRSACYGQCATYWPPLMKKGTLSAGAGVKANLLGTTKRKNGTRQVTYNGHPYTSTSSTRVPGRSPASARTSSAAGGTWSRPPAARSRQRPRRAEGRRVRRRTRCRPTPSTRLVASET